MIRMLLMLTGLLVAGTSPLSAETITIPLPELHGTYPTDDIYERTVTITLDPVPIAIHSVSISVAGHQGAGEITCGAETIHPWPMEILGYMDDPDGGWWSASLVGPEEASQIAEMLPFVPSISDSPSWDFLLAGPAELYFMVAPVPIIAICMPVTWPVAEITEVVLLIEADLSVATESGSWGRIKALYR